MKTLTLETDHKIKLPVGWVKELGGIGCYA